MLGFLILFEFWENSGRQGVSLQKRTIQTSAVSRGNKSRFHGEPNPEALSVTQLQLVTRDSPSTGNPRGAAPGMYLLGVVTKHPQGSHLLNTGNKHIYKSPAGTLSS